MTETRNSKVLADFVAYCEAHPSERFWQALRNWAEVKYVVVTDVKGFYDVDTFYWEGRRGDR